MNLLFLQSLPLGGGNGMVGGAMGPALLGSMIGAIIGFLIVGAIIGIVLYVYISLAYSKIGSKVGLYNPGIAWMPGTGPLAVIFETSKMHWWPFPFGIASYILLLIIMSFGMIGSTVLMTIGSILSFAISITFLVMIVIWHWKTYESVGKPGWWAIIPVVLAVIGILFSMIGIPVLGIIGLLLFVIGGLSHLVLIGIAAWSSMAQQ